jgi:sugar lactone lactonase YvrE
MFNAPRGICADTNGTLVVADSNNSCIRRIDTDGEQRSRTNNHKRTDPCLTSAVHACRTSARQVKRER